MAAVSHALEHMHDRRVIYRDLKPELLAGTEQTSKTTRHSFLAQELASRPQRLPEVGRHLAD